MAARVSLVGRWALEYFIISMKCSDFQSKGTTTSDDARNIPTLFICVALFSPQNPQLGSSLNFSLFQFACASQDTSITSSSSRSVHPESLHRWSCCLTELAK